MRDVHARLHNLHNLHTSARSVVRSYDDDHTAARRRSHG
jgi:hypothetical protein